MNISGSHSYAPFDPGRLRAITLDLDDTLWPIWPTIARAEEVTLPLKNISLAESLVRSESLDPKSR